ncbi:hypothetical protein K438DRAFT_1781877 [Mycena galopus ATCC 62051]|nr:hypothetical protein K438DRAFT_1781877 [Mycena galopus ATCC 62051]
MSSDVHGRAEEYARRRHCVKGSIVAVMHNTVRCDGVLGKSSCRPVAVECCWNAGFEGLSRCTRYYIIAPGPLQVPLAELTVTVDYRVLRTKLAAIELAELEGAKKQNTKQNFNGFQDESRDSGA